MPTYLLALIISEFECVKMENFPDEPPQYGDRIGVSLETNVFNANLKIGTISIPIEANHLTISCSQTCTTKHYLADNAGEFATITADKVMSLFDGHFGPENVYPFSKMDSAAVPDFFFGVRKLQFKM